MKLSKDSLWNRFLNWQTKGNLPSDVCTYVSTSFCAILLWGTILGVSLLFVAGFFVFPYHIYHGTVEDEMSMFIELLMYCGVMVWMVLVSLVIVFMSCVYMDYVYPVIRKIKPNKTKSNEPSVISQWIEDKKEKICTRIEYE